MMLIVPGVRGIAWGVFLEALPKSPSAMVEAASAVRTQYDQYVQTYIVDPRSKTEELDPSINNPLSQDEEVPQSIVHGLNFVTQESMGSFLSK